MTYNKIEADRLFEQLDPVTKEHTENMMFFIDNLGSTFNLSRIKKMKLRLSVQLHDVGKIVIPPEILDKPGPLTPSEKEVMDLHAYATYEMIHAFVPNDIAQIASNHHAEPTPEIHRLSKILTLLDKYEAIRNENRPYKSGKSHDTTMAILSTSNDVDQRLVAEFARFTQDPNNPIRSLYPEAPIQKEQPSNAPDVDPAILNAPEIQLLKSRAIYFKEHRRPPFLRVMLKEIKTDATKKLPTIARKVSLAPGNQELLSQR